MKRRFIVASEGLSADERKQVLAYLRSHGAWWSWIENFWLLVVEDTDDINTEKIRDHITSISKTARTLVLEIGNEIDWSGRGTPNKEGKNQHDWLKTTWSDAGEAKS